MTHTKTVLLARGESVSWAPHRKVWVGASSATITAAASTVLVWALERAGVAVPINVATALSILIGALGATAVYFGSAYWVTEPPTSTPGKRIN